jgi:predicted metal-binding membrane protein
VNAVEAVLRRERAVIAVSLAALAVLAWLIVWRGAGMGMPALHMTALALFPHLQPDMPGHMATALPVVVAMWWVMMVAMMTPSVAPLVLLYGRVARHHAGHAGVYAASGALLLGYLAAWALFSLVAALLQQALQPAGLISPMMLWSKSAWLSAAVLGLAGLYQFSPLKRTCLARCRGPVEFLTRYWRPGRAGAFVLGAHHGAYCVGCCWMLMALLFVGGVMNLAWIAALSLLVLAEKLAPGGELVGKVSGALLLVWAAATLVVS